MRKFFLLLLIFFFLSKETFASLGDFSISDEAKLGKKFYVYITSHYPLVHDPYIVNYVRKLANRIKRILPPQPFDITVDVIYSPQINAFAGPGGHVFVYTGLISIMGTEEELAGVLCHEFSHVTQRHIARNIKRQKFLTMGSLVGVLAGALIGKSVGEAIAVGSMAGAQSAMLKYTREEEREADEIGIQYLTKAGYPPSAMISAFLRLKREKILSGENNVPPYFLTHPGIEERISYLKYMVKLMHSKGKSISNKEFNKAKTLIIAHYTDPDKGMDLISSLPNKCERLLARAVLMSRENRVREAEKLFSNDSCGKELNFYFREKGRFYFELGRLDVALEFLNKAIREDPKDYFALYFRGRIYGDMGKYKLAVDDLTKVLEYVPHDSEVHTLLGRIEGRYISPFYGYLHYAYAAMYRGNKEDVVKYLSRAKSLAKNKNEKDLLKKFEEQYKRWKRYW